MTQKQTQALLLYLTQTTLYENRSAAKRREREKNRAAGGEASE